MFLTVTITISVILLTTLSKFPLAANVESCSDNFCTTFNDYGYPYKKIFKAVAEQQEKLHLVAAGMRRKSLLILEVDVYTVGIFFSDNKDEDMKQAKTLSEISLPTIDSGISVGVVLHFVRGVSTQKVVDAIVEALTAPGDEYNRQLTQFSEFLLSSIGPNGVKKDDEVLFTFYGVGEELGISFNDNYVGTVLSKEVRAKLLAIYTGEKAVAPAVYETLTKVYGKKV